ncbi:hypothetical protein [Bradyrhizobium sp. JR4.1]|uniref:hypothetical protein n=1 Tax=Bradyrhizobium sp. JR4.1 TaxID=3156372 RepID=UPI00339934BE
MKPISLLTLGAACLIAATAGAEAGGTGKFLASLLARGVAREAIGAAVRSNNTMTVYVPKTYGPDVLTVDQLAVCMKRANALDGENDRIEGARSSLQTMKLAIDAKATDVEFKRIAMNRYSKKSVDDFNALIESYNALVTAGKARQADFNASVDAHNVGVDGYNAACVKRYYADDMEEAKKLAAVN